MLLLKIVAPFSITRGEALDRVFYTQYDFAMCRLEIQKHLSRMNLPPIYACPMSTKMMLLISIVLVSHPLSYINIVAAIDERRREGGWGGGRKWAKTNTYANDLLYVIANVNANLRISNAGDRSYRLP